jgi:hypothetical protein
VLGDCAYGNKTELRTRLDSAGRRYVLSVSPDTTVFCPEIVSPCPTRARRGGMLGKRRASARTVCRRRLAR